MTGNNDELLDVVAMNLALPEPVPAPLYKALTTNKRSSIQDLDYAEKGAALHRAPGHMISRDDSSDPQLPM